MISSLRQLSLAVLPLSLFVSGCGILGVCTTELRSNLNVAVRDSATRAPVAQGATGLATHRDGMATELSAIDSLMLIGSWGRERPGRYSVEVRKPGYRTARANTEVEESGCHVETQTVQIALARDPNAVAQSPLRFNQGQRFSGDRASAGIRVLGDTLEICPKAQETRGDDSAPPAASARGCRSLREHVIPSLDQKRMVKPSVRRARTPGSSCSGSSEFSRLNGFPFSKVR
jgi:hypothetical protein